MYTGTTVGLRPLDIADVACLTNLANDPEVRQLVVGWDWPVEPLAQEEWLKNSNSPANTHRLAVYDLESGVTVGLTGLWDIDWHNRSALSAVKLDKDTAPRGSGTDAIKLVNAWAFYEVGLHRLWGSILDFNGPSFGAYVGKGGWKFEGTERQAVFKKGQWVDLHKVAILRSDFEELPDWEEYRDRICPVSMENKIELPRL